MKKEHGWGDNSMKPLEELATGKRGVVRQLKGGRAFTTRLFALGFTIGAEVTVTRNYGRGPIVVSICDTSIALGRGEAEKLLVEVTPTR